MPTKKPDLEAMRQKLLGKMNKDRRDQDEVKPPKDGTFKLRFVFLPGINSGDTYSERRGELLKPKTAGSDDSMDDEFYVPNGKHFFKKGSGALECPRAQSGGYCPLCDFGFDLMQGQSKKERSAIARKFIAQERWAINIYVLNDKTNPEEYRDRVMWMNFPKTVQDMLKECLAREDFGDEADPQAYSIFFHPDNCYIFQLSVRPKGGYPTYTDSKFLAQGGPLTLEAILKKTKSQYSVDEVLNMRFSLKKKFEAPDLDKLQAKVDQFKSGVTEFEDDESDDDESDDGESDGESDDGESDDGESDDGESEDDEPEDDEPEDDEPEDDEPEDDEPKPKPKPKSKSSKKVDKKNSLSLEADEDIEAALGDILNDMNDGDG